MNYFKRRKQETERIIELLDSIDKQLFSLNSDYRGANGRTATNYQINNQNKYR